MNVSKLSGNFLIDMDEVLVDISPGLYRSIRLNWIKYSKFFKDLGPLKDKEILARPVFKMVDWLLKDEYQNFERLNELKKLLDTEMLTDYSAEDFYNLLEPTEFAKRTLMNKSFMEHIRVKKVYIITRYFNDEMLESKKRFIKKYFNNPKIETIAVPRDAKKSDYIKSLNIDWNLFVDDEIKNIADFAENLNLKEKEFLIPKLGYNDMNPILDILIKGKGGVVNYYDPLD